MYVTTHNVHVLEDVNGTLRPAGALYEPVAETAEASPRELLADHAHTAPADFAVSIFVLKS